MRKYLLPEQGNFYKANLHCHTTVSDGKLTPEQIKQVYKEHGYSVVAFTDHDVMIGHPELADDDFLPLKGYEMEINQPRPEGMPYGKTCHMCFIATDPDIEKQVCWHREKYTWGNAKNIWQSQVKFDENEPDYERYYTPECINDMIRRGREAGFFVTYNHPCWSMEEYTDYVNYNGMNAMEICNYACVSAGYPDYVPYIYDSMLRAGKRIYAVAADDNHNVGEFPGKDSCGGYIQIKADKLDYRTITKAMLDGNFYASQGPDIYELYLEDNILHVKCSAARQIAMNTGDRRTEFLNANEGESVTEAAFKVRPSDIYFRLTVTDHSGRPANTRGYFVDEWL